MQQELLIRICFIALTTCLKNYGVLYFIKWDLYIMHILLYLKSDNTGTKTNANLLVQSLSTADNDVSFLGAECWFCSENRLAKALSK